MTTDVTIALIGTKVMELSADMDEMKKNIQRIKDILKNIERRAENTENYLLLKKEKTDLKL